MQMGEGYGWEFRWEGGGRRVLCGGFLGIVYYCLKILTGVNCLVDSGLNRVNGYRVVDCGVGLGLSRLGLVVYFKLGPEIDGLDFV